MLSPIPYITEYALAHIHPGEIACAACRHIKPEEDSAYAKQLFIQLAVTPTDDWLDPVAPGTTVTQLIESYFQPNRYPSEHHQKTCVRCGADSPRIQKMVWDGALPPFVTVVLDHFAAAGGDGAGGFKDRKPIVPSPQITIRGTAFSLIVQSATSVTEIRIDSDSHPGDHVIFDWGYPPHG